MFDLTTGVGELILRAVIVYFFLFTLFRFLGKKHAGEMTPFETSSARRGSGSSRLALTSR
jgi:hypothetical protein